MAHIDEKLEQLHQYHLIINDIAEALGYRRGQTYGPFELVGKVKELIHERDMTIEACRGTQMDDAGIWSVKELVKKLAAVEAERDAAVAFHNVAVKERNHERAINDRLSRILAALREPSEAVLDAATTAMEEANVYVMDTKTPPPTMRQQQDKTFVAGVRAAVAAAEQEVGA